MSLIIKANTFARQRFLEVHTAGVIFCHTSAMGGRRTFTYSQIDCVLLSEDGLLSFQVGGEVFSLPMRLDNAQHREALEALVDGVKKSREMVSHAR